MRRDRPFFYAITNIDIKKKCTYTRGEQQKKRRLADPFPRNRDAQDGLSGHEMRCVVFFYSLIHPTSLHKYVRSTACTTIDECGRRSIGGVANVCSGGRQPVADRIRRPSVPVSEPNNYRRMVGATGTFLQRCHTVAKKKEKIYHYNKKKPAGLAIR